MSKIVWFVDFEMKTIMSLLFLVCKLHKSLSLFLKKLQLKTNFFQNFATNVFYLCKFILDFDVDINQIKNTI